VEGIKHFITLLIVVDILSKDHYVYHLAQIKSQTAANSG
jgi:hypothetical protein